MKRLLFVLCLASVLLGCEISHADMAKKEARKASERAQIAAQASIEVPDLTYFQERRTIAKWAKHWDKPSAACYVYLISYGTIIGYYVSDGKPASNRSYITPPDQKVAGSNGNIVMEAPDIDGCYGDNNPGIRFFTASGVAVEWGGSGASYIYSDIPLKLNVPLLGE